MTQSVAVCELSQPLACLMEECRPPSGFASFAIDNQCVDGIQGDPAVMPVHQPGLYPSR